MKKAIQFLLILLFLILLTLVVYLRIDDKNRAQDEITARIEAAETIPAAAEIPASQPLPSSTPTPEPTPEPTPTPTPEPTPELLTISVIGDLTLTSHQNLSSESPSSYAYIMGDDYSYPFKNTVQYFENDEFTISNLECTLSDTPMYSGQMFYFRAPTAYANIMLEGGVDFVTTANNHSLDFGQAGLQSTYDTLDEYGIPYGKENEAQIITSKNGLHIGIYCAYNDYIPSIDKATEAIQQLKTDGADYIICAFHWGQELYYSPNGNQIKLGRACIDAGADLIYGTHTHCLQPVEEYNGGIILYSMGNWSFGGNTSPSDRDTAIIQVTLKRDLDGTISRESVKAIPCCVSSRPVYENYTGDNYNDYCPTPYEPDTEDYDRVMSKLDGSYVAAKEGADYTNYYASFG